MMSRALPSSAAAAARLLEFLQAHPEAIRAGTPPPPRPGKATINLQPPPRTIIDVLCRQGYENPATHAASSRGEHHLHRHHSPTAGDPPASNFSRLRRVQK